MLICTGSLVTKRIRLHHYKISVTPSPFLAPLTMTYFGVNLTYPSESGHPICSYSFEVEKLNFEVNKLN